jgi:hypothetical protein
VKKPWEYRDMGKLLQPVSLYWARTRPARPLTFAPDYARSIAERDDSLLLQMGIVSFYFNRPA